MFFQFLGCVFFEEVDGIVDCYDGFSGVVWNFDVEFFFECYYQFDCIQVVGVQVVDEVCVFDYFVGFDVQVFDNNFFYVISDVIYCFFFSGCCFGIGWI